MRCRRALLQLLIPRPPPGAPPAQNMIQLFEPLAPMGGAREQDWENESTTQLTCTWRPNLALEEAAMAAEYNLHLAKLVDVGVPLDMVFVSLHTCYLHQSNIPQRALRLVRTLADDGPVQQL